MIAAKLISKNGASKIIKNFLLFGLKINPKILKFQFIKNKVTRAEIRYKQPKIKANIYPTLKDQIFSVESKVTTPSSKSLYKWASKLQIAMG